MKGKPGSLPPGWQAFIDTVASQQGCLTDQVMQAAIDLFVKAYSDGQASPGDVTREYSKEEYLLVVDRQGLASGTGAELLGGYRKTCLAYSQFGRWFQEGCLVAEQAGDLDMPGEPVLLAARWLCHLVGLRHQTVELFLDPPGLDGHTLVQIRGLDKVDSPGAFDLPCAGHMDGTDGVMESLEKELGEELGLELDDLEALERIGMYESGVRTDEERRFINVELCHLFRARLKPGRAGRVRFADGEVAGLAVFNRAELEKLVLAYPERVAAGLKDSLPYLG